MPLTLRKNSDQWYADFVHAGKRRVVRLNVLVEGLRPSHLREQGDAKFERSRIRASLALEQLLKELREPKAESDRLKRIHELDTGSAPETSAIHPDVLFELWRAAPSRRKGGKKKRSAEYEHQVKALTEKFSAFLQKTAKISDVRRLRHTHVLAFLDTTVGPKATGKSWNNNLAALAAVFRATQRAHDLPNDPFKKVFPKAEDESVSRRPYNPEEIGRILRAAETDEGAGAVAITAATTGMRRKDCANLTWAHVDLGRGFIKVTASKTGEPLDIPILPPLRRCLERAWAKKDASGRCFPLAAAMYANNPDGLTVRLRHILETAGVLRAESNPLPGQPATQRLRKAPDLGFHNFKTSFITMALNSGVPLELLKKIVGNSTVEIVLTHYYHPDSERIAEVIRQKMPRVITEEAPQSPADPPPASLHEVRQLIESLTAENWAQQKAAILARLASSPN